MGRGRGAVCRGGLPRLLGASRGQKSDRLDAFGLAEQLRIGAIGTKVYAFSAQPPDLHRLSFGLACAVTDDTTPINSGVA